MYAKKKVSVKAVVLLLAVVLMIGCVAGGTLAWLITSTNSVQNTFVAGDIGDLDLTETLPEGKSAIVTPGVNITKDPVVTFEGNNVAAYVFLKVDAAGWTVTGSGTTYTYTIGEGNAEMTWTLEGWTELADGIYYKEVDAGADQEWHIVQGDTITVESGITEANIANYANTLTFTAYATQMEKEAGVNFTPAEAWALFTNS